MLAVATQGVQKIVCILIIMGISFLKVHYHIRSKILQMIDLNRVDWPESEISIKSEVV